HSELSVVQRGSAAQSRGRRQGQEVERMMPILARVLTALAILGCILGSRPVAAQEQNQGSKAPEPQLQTVGQVDFPVSCDPRVQGLFNRSVALLHSFAGSPNGFLGVLRQDPTCAMAYWGIALTWLGNPLGGPPNPERSQ